MKINLKKTFFLSVILFLFLQIFSLPSKTFIKSQISYFNGHSTFLDKNIPGNNNLFFIDFATNSTSLKHFFKFVTSSGFITFFIFLILICGVIGSYKDKEERILMSFFKNISIFWWKALFLFFIYVPIFLLFSISSFYLSKTFISKTFSLGKILPFIFGLFISLIFIFGVKLFYMVSKVSLITKNLSIFSAFLYPFKNIKNTLKKFLPPFIIYVILLAFSNIFLIYLLMLGISNTLIYILIELFIFIKLFIINALYNIFENKIENLI